MSFMQKTHVPSISSSSESGSDEEENDTPLVKRSIVTSQESPMSVADSAISKMETPSTDIHNKKHISIQEQEPQELAQLMYGISKILDPKPSIQDLKKNISTGSIQQAQHGEQAQQVFEFKRPTSNIEKTEYFIQTHSKKLYHSGYLYKKNECGVDGKSLTNMDSIGNRGTLDPGAEWVKWWAELKGTVLHLWRVPDEIASMSYEPEPNLERLLELELSPAQKTIDTIKSSHDNPIYINVSDASSEFLDHLFKPMDSEVSPLPPIPYTSYFALSTAGSNLFLFATSSYISSNTWIGAIRLSMFELGLVHYVFSMNLLRVPPYINAWSDNNIPPFHSAWHKGEVKYSGVISARHAFQVTWKEYFCIVNQVKVVSKTSEPTSKRSSVFFGKKKDEQIQENKQEQSQEETVKGQILFYESKSEMKKGSPPLMIVEDVVASFALWPEKAQLVKMDLVGLVKIEGNVILENKSEKKKDKNRASVLRERPQSILFPIKPDALKSASQSSSPQVNPSNLPSRPNPPYLLLTSANTYESLHWLVSILGAFRLNADIDRCDVLSSLWLDPPADWGTLCLSVNEIAGFSTIVSPHQSFLDYYKLLNDKQIIWKGGLLSNWTESTLKGYERRIQYERREVQVKARELINWIHNLKTEIVKLPHWVENELSLKFGEDYMKKFERQNVDEQLEKESQVESIVGVSTIDRKRISSLPRNFEELKQQHLESNNGSDITSLLEIQQEETQKQKQGQKIIDLNVTIPQDFTFNDSIISDWYKEEKDRLEARDSWIAGLDLLETNQESASKFGEKYLFQSDSLMGSLTEPLQKRQVSGPLINSIQSREITDPSRKYRETLIFGDSKNPNTLVESSSEEEEEEVLIKKEFKLFSENSLLDKKANEPLLQPKESDGPLLGNIQREANKPKLESGLLGQMDRMEKEWENIKKRGGYRATMMPSSEMMGYPMSYIPFPPQQGVYPNPPNGYPNVNPDAHANPNANQGPFPYPYYFYPPPPQGYPMQPPQMNSQGYPMQPPQMNPQGYPIMYPPFMYPGMPMYPQAMAQNYPMTRPLATATTAANQEEVETELLKQQWLENERRKKTISLEKKISSDSLNANRRSKVVDMDIPSSSESESGTETISSQESRKPRRKQSNEGAFQRLQDQDDSSGTEEDNVPIMSSPSSGSHKQQPIPNAYTSPLVRPSYPVMYYPGSSQPFYPHPYSPSFQSFYQQPLPTASANPPITNSSISSPTSNTHPRSSQVRQITSIQQESSGTEESDLEKLVKRKREKVKVAPGKRK